MGETAPLIMLGALQYVLFLPRSVWDYFTVLPIQIFTYVALPNPEFQRLAAAGILLLLAVLLVYETVAFGLRLHRRLSRWELDERVERALRQAALWDEVKDHLHRKSGLELSGGQQQRLCIARALATDPEVLLDEPCSALDPVSTARIEALMADLVRERTLVIVTHNLAQAARVSDVTAFLLDGELVEWGPTAAVFTRPTDPRTEDYVAGRFG